MTAQIRVYVVTYRRPHLLERALQSLLAQTYSAWVAEVLNDDPEDPRVAALISRIADPRVTLSPPQRRGGTGNFNYAFRAVAESFAAILEDDNWWEPEFLATMMDAFARNPDIALACGNERLWREQIGGTWRDSGQTIWPVTSGETRFDWNILDKCGAAKICNSSMVFRTAFCEAWRTPPSIPIDVTEHFRERAVPHPLLLVMSPLVNYGDTLVTHRSKTRSVWASYQLLLVGSVFALIAPDRRAGLADDLWRKARKQLPLLSSTLLAAGAFIPEASELWRRSGILDRVVFYLRALRRPLTTLTLSRVRTRHRTEWEWLQKGAFADFLKAQMSDSHHGKV
jgi:glycosyltransferase involved in cell wall biosynthesis